MSQLISVNLTPSEIEHLIRLVRARKRQNERKLAKSTFVPEPGHRNAHEIYLEVSDRLLAKLQAAKETACPDPNSPPPNAS